MTNTEATNQTTGMQTVSATDFAETKLAMPLLRQVILGLQANQHRPTANTKTRGEVSGGGKKPWRQKGTGRARVGSSRTPVWRGGGIVFGPTSIRNFSHTLPIALKLGAMSTLLPLKARAGALHQVTLSAAPATTKTALKAIPELLTLPRVLLVLPSAEYARAFRNIEHVTPILVSDLNVLDIANFPHIVFVGETYSELKAKLVK